MEPDLYKDIRDIDVCKELEMLKVKVPINFLGTMGFSARREGRYSTRKAEYFGLLAQWAMRKLNRTPYSQDPVVLKSVDYTSFYLLLFF
jgi:hypothetical protein